MESIVKKIAKIKGIGYIALAVGAAVLLLLIPSSKKNDDKEIQPYEKSAEEYISSLEKKTEELLKKIDGVSECKVMINVDAGYQYYYAADQTVQHSFGSDGKTLSDSEQKKYVTVGSSGTVSLVKTKEAFPKISGIAVVCPGSNDGVRLAVTETVKALFNISSNRISVQK